MIFNNMCSLWTTHQIILLDFTSGGRKVVPHNTVPQGTAWCIIYMHTDFVICSFRSSVPCRYFHPRVHFLYPFHISPEVQSQRHFENNGAWCESSKAALFDSGIRKAAFNLWVLLLTREVFWKRILGKSCLFVTVQLSMWKGAPNNAEWKCYALHTLSH